jgi:hypothetical protein
MFSFFGLLGFGSDRIYKENFTMLQNKKNSLVTLGITVHSRTYGRALGFLRFRHILYLKCGRLQTASFWSWNPKEKIRPLSQLEGQEGQFTFFKNCPYDPKFFFFSKKPI